MNRHDPEDLLETIISRAAALLGTPHGFIYLLEPDGASLVVRHGIGMFTDFLGYRMPIDRASRAWSAARAGRSRSTTTTPGPTAPRTCRPSCSVPSSASR